jgi:hypothetical protein
MQDNQNAYNLASRFTPSYYALRRLVRTPTRESDMHLLPPWEFHAETTRLIQMLRNGHHQVTLDAEAWDRLITWIDLGAPAHGTWTDICGVERVAHQAKRRAELRRRYTGMTDDPEANPLGQPAADHAGDPGEKSHHACSGPRGDRQTCLTRSGGRHSIDRPRISLELAYLDTNLWMGQFEVTNEQFALFDPAHHSGLEYGDYIHFSPGERGWSLARPANRSSASPGTPPTPFAAGSRKDRAAASGCPPRRSGNTPVAPARPPHSGTARWTPISPSMRTCPTGRIRHRSIWLGRAAGSDSALASGRRPVR